MATPDLQQQVQQTIEQLHSKDYLKALSLSFLSKMQLEILGSVLEKTHAALQKNPKDKEQELHALLQHFEVFLKGLKKENLNDEQMVQLLPIIETMKNFLDDQAHPLIIRQRTAAMGAEWNRISGEVKPAAKPNHPGR